MMPCRFATLVLILSTSIASGGFSQQVSAQQPADTPSGRPPTAENNAPGATNKSPRILDLPPGVEILIPDTSAPSGVNPDPAAERIRDALGGKNTPPAGGILGDVLDLIRGQGSVLEGSVLDPKSGGQRFDNETKHTGDSYVPNQAPGSAALPFSPNRKHGIRRVDVAESLLRTARLLESLEQSDPETPARKADDAEGDEFDSSDPADQSTRTADLIRAMRLRATNLLMQEYAPRDARQDAPQYAPHSPPKRHPENPTAP